MTDRPFNGSNSRWHADEEAGSDELRCAAEVLSGHRIFSDQGYSISTEMDGGVTLKLSEGSQYNPKTGEYDHWEEFDSRSVDAVSELLQTIAEWAAMLEAEDRVVEHSAIEKLDRFTE